MSAIQHLTLLHRLSDAEEQWDWGQPPQETIPGASGDLIFRVKATLFDTRSSLKFSPPFLFVSVDTGNRF